MEPFDKAKAIAEGRNKDLCYKTLTLGQLSRSERWHPVGKRGETMWNHGERVLAFEDGTLAFKESGADLWGTLDNVDDLAKWIDLLDKFHEGWECGPIADFSIFQAS
jgi:hypothetical protein